MDKSNQINELLVQQKIISEIVCACSQIHMYSHSMLFYTIFNLWFELPDPRGPLSTQLGIPSEAYCSSKIPTTQTSVH